LELALLIKDPWKIFLTTDHPNGGPFTSYPRIIAWLISKEARKATMKRLNPRARSRSLLSSINRELTFQDIAIMTRAGQAKALRLNSKGHLGVGADADVAIYDVNPKITDPSRQYKTVRKAFKHAAYTIKGGKVVVKQDNVVQQVNGSTIWLDLQTSEPAEINEDMKRRFREYWTVEYDNYPVSDHYIENSQPITVRAQV
jgi:formylmethanofuran dehydrogenase subunit A